MNPVLALEFVLLAALWGASFLFTRLGAAELGALPTAGMRVALAALFLLPVFLVRGVWADFKRNARAILFVGLLNSGIPFVLFAWAAHGEAPPDTANLPTFRPFMLAHPLEDTVVDLADYAAEWKWDGIRVQLVRMAGETRLYSRGGDDISATFPELLDVLPFDGLV